MKKNHSLVKDESYSKTVRFDVLMLIHIWPGLIRSLPEYKPF